MANSSNMFSNSTVSEQMNSDSSSHYSASDWIEMPILCLTIILATVYSILLLLRAAFRTNKHNWFTVNMCLISVLLSAIFLAMSVKRLNNTSSSLPCRLQGFLLNMTTCQLLYSHAVIAVNRYLTIIHANKRFFRSTVCIWTCLGFGWLIASLVAMPYLFISSFACSNSSKSDFLPYYTLFANLVVPVVIVMICNIRIFLFVRQSSRRVHAEGGRGVGVSHTRDLRLLKTMILTLTVFVVGWFPLFIRQTFSQSITIDAITDGIFQVFPSLSMLCDVILLIYINQPVRLFLYQFIHKRKPEQIVLQQTFGRPVRVNADLPQKY